MKKLLLVTMVILVCFGAANLAFAESYDSFNEYITHGISMSPSTFTTGTPSVYTLTLNSDAYLVYSGDHYAITSIFGFYAVGKNFQATGDSFTFDESEWKWVKNSNSNGAYAGWNNNSKKSKITPGTSRTFSFDSMTVSNPAPVIGLHVILDLGNKKSPFGCGNTGYIIPIKDPMDINIVPEPGSFIALGTGIVGIAGLVKRKRRV